MQLHGPWSPTFGLDQLLLLLTIMWSQILEQGKQYSPHSMGFAVVFWEAREFNGMGMARPD